LGTDLLVSTLKGSGTSKSLIQKVTHDYIEKHNLQTRKGEKQRE
jgi:hypothetical protein